ncbi:2-polyprenyl-3-methyl-5-hydroxy-6-metoxy-1,4-benzoquinol methylase [Bacillus mesophilus]|uniref:Methyltransferase domain-containing protein n=1 Tax=Bacillus mesophilus TaxID=1808955 RepID=A0A6M0Q7E6_9BACI|nr:methyltransferase domain-containing protein [Bacillus mesophilus]MBM7661585.1 2-polyprenyl-3-methyl-5-hydroxy-6-metoxy-1,4-benzoquinol methylase [Bacillus mesophilus]NEY72254.1 methyltransferase domain-containing protein [Bacillus mesophilus]
MLNQDERISKIKKDIEGLINIGKTLDADELLEDLRAILVNDPDFYSMKGVIELIKGNLDIATQLFKKGLTFAPMHYNLNYNLGYIYKEGKQNELAYEYYKNALDFSVTQEETLEAEAVLNDLKNKISPLKRERKRLAFFVKKGLDQFIDEIINNLSIDYQTKKIIVTHIEDIDKGMEWAEICWFDWCDELLIHASKKIKNNKKKIICRLHSYEAFTNNVSSVNWENVDNLIFVSNHIKDYVLKHNILPPDLEIEVIPNGINLDRYKFVEREKGYNIAYVGYINYKKGPMLLLHTFKAIHDSDNRYKLHVAGAFQDPRYELYFKQMISELKLENAIHLYGWVDNINEWLNDKHYILSTSVLEGHPVGVMEAMARGIKPLIHNYVGAKQQFNGYVWDTIEEVVNKVNSTEYSPVEYRDFIDKNYSLASQIDKLHSLLSSFKDFVIDQSLDISDEISDETNNQPSEETVEKFYNNFLSYLKTDRERENPRHIRLKKRLSDIIKEEHTVLDLGCGIGITSEFIKSLGVKEVIGVDLSPELIKYAQETVNNVEFIVGDITMTQLNKKFDIITLCDVIEHIPRDKYQLLFNNISKHLKEDGQVYISIPDPDYLDYVRLKSPKSLQVIDNSITLNEIREFCNSAELNISLYNIFGIDVEYQYNEYLLNKSNVKKWNIFG